jgi:hypothetical protein
MNTFTAILILLTLFILRFGVPFVLSVGMTTWMDFWAKKQKQ